MKATLTKSYRDYTLNEIDSMKAVIAAEKEDEATPKYYAELAINEALKENGGAVVEVLKVTVETALNNRIWNAYGKGTFKADLWIEATAETTTGFIKIGAYLTDIWKTGGEDYSNYMYIKRYSIDR